MNKILDKAADFGNKLVSVIPIKNSPLKKRGVLLNNFCLVYFVTVSVLLA